MRMILLMNIRFSYPSSFVEKQFRQFFLPYVNPSPFLPSIQQEKDFFLARNRIVHQTTLRPSPTLNDTANNDDDDNGIHDPVEMTNHALPLTIGNAKRNCQNTIILHYTHEKRFSSMKRDLHQTYDTIFNNTPASDVQLIVGNRNRRTARDDLIRKKPLRALLTNKPTQRECFLAQQPLDLCDI
jgi:hypothetical protein